ncbi:putative disease resistance protein RGA1 [Sorghum bicolor]|uniref:AAA+ ATPase domain-containing protein n=1 Tax=Sorghum bicolor TaxID=4558 RepID=A0A1B6PNB7_SORBI|nr:putative disease resistance protein RGA1 [Sorghum bicolor]XP_021319417.1 putative disease resistance protein RGA1 [Sorghum bicolor]XP_021319418.1 putative disease resistance protein RGA1 [Sorghum bicolor]XP_021319419.1 putative disease resistance protein RGA1 [Sorghum bicolor]XP_021319420.1 putative disease resistance protein RGA1 [Sorghum bicolor]XP_021319421.1 putative disease resistance protein RGA1 [Sorghum bicolor]KXG27159.1 hypothetical protein SORBI_3006G222800 [Sorghum bicolor]|eukprot:XP_021319416.1 putative disease resistance protein RGA1 [Sorghum bicolor]
MEVAVSAASWVLGKALGPITDGLLEAWAASAGLGPNMDALKMELLYAQGMLDNAQGREIRSSALKELLLKLQQLAYGADDVLDELDYFRIQDELDGTYHAADVHGGGCVRDLVLNTRHTARAVARKLKLSSGSRQASRGDPDPDEHEDGAKQGCFSVICSCGRHAAIGSTPNSPNIQSDENGGCMSKVALSARRAAHTIGNGWARFCCACPSKIQSQEGKRVVQIPKLKFDRVEISSKMKDIVEKLRPVSAKVSTILDMELLGSAILKLEQLGSNRTTTQNSAMDRPKTTPDIIEPKLYGRDNQKKIIIDGIKHGEYFSDGLVVLPIVGPGGIGKTTFTQHIYKEVKDYFEVTIWLCVSLNFNASRLAQEAVKIIPEVDGENKNGSDQERIEQRLKAKRFLLVLDDMWTCHEDEWKKLLAPFGRGGQNGNMVIVTTRIPEVADMVKTIDCPIKMDRLEATDFMHFFEACVFGQQGAWEDHPELHDVGEKIMSNLKGFPLGAKTVGRVLRNQLTLDHWTRVLESKEWELQTNENDIMPALKLSYDYLPFHLQRCFSYCSLFPEDYEFGSDELIHLWMGLDILHTSSQNKRTEDVGLSYLIDLLNNGFFIKNEKDDGTSYYVLHDLLHDLAVKVSSYECITIPSSKVRSIQILTSVRHLSIIIDDKEVENKENFDNFKKELRELDKRLNTENLRTLMLFGSHHGSFAMIFGHLFRNANALRAIYLSEASYIVEDVLNNFSKLVHLRYLRIKSKYMEDICLLSALSRLYHLEVIDLQEWEHCSGSVRYINNLVKLRHFLVPKDKVQLHSNIVEVGKLKLLQELRSFEVGKEGKGFELSQLEQLSELGGSLAIGNLERTQTMKEGSEAKLIHKSRLRKLSLEWAVNRLGKDPTHESNILEVMKPHVNLQGICIKGHGGTNCPKWLGENLSVKNLESLHLDDVSWENFPPLGELGMVNGHGEEHLGCLPHNRFRNLRRLEFNKLPRLKRWAESDPCNLFSHLEVLIITCCFELTELSFSHSICCQRQKEAKINWFPRLREVKIEDCPKLLSFPPIPWTRAPCSAKIKDVGSGIKELVCEENYRSGYSLKIKMKHARLWKLLAFDNLTELKELKVQRCPPLPLHHFRKLSSLKTIELSGGSRIVFPSVEGESHTESQSPVECITVRGWGASGKELTQLLTCFPKLSKLKMWSCKKITGLAVVEKQAIETPTPTSPDNRVDGNVEIEQQNGTGGEEEIGASSAEEGLLLLPSQLQQLDITYCQELSLCSNSIDHNRESGPTSGGQGLQSLRSLRSLSIGYCPKFLSSYSSPSSSSSCPPFPTSLERLSLFGAGGMATLLPLSNLASLTDLTIWGCGDLRGEGLRHLLAQGRLTKLIVRETPNFWAGPYEQEFFPSSSSKLQELVTDDVAGVLAASVCTLLSSTLADLRFWSDKKVERFTKEQEDALQLLTSLEEIRFWDCDKLQCLPAGLHGLPNLKRLNIYKCPAIRSLPKDGLPSSLQELEIDDCPAIQILHKDCLPTSLQKLEMKRCPAIRSLPKDCLPSSLQKLVISNCPAIRSLPKVNDLLSSLRELNVRYSHSEELRRQCRKLIGIIPVVYA